jgi:hypothetical protein
MSGHSMKMLEQYLHEKKEQAERLRDNTSQKDYFKGQVEIIDEILADIKKKPIPFNPWLMPF